MVGELSRAERRAIRAAMRARIAHFRQQWRLFKAAIKERPR